MSNFDEALKSAWAANLSVDGGLSESITYVPRVGSTRAIDAIIKRDVPRSTEEINSGLVNVLEATVRNDSTYGISATELDPAGGDKLRIPWTLGATGTSADDKLLGYPSQQNAATLTFRIGRS